MKEIVSYLNFDGTTREAMTFYAKCFDAELTLMPMGDYPGGGSPQAKDRIMHARLGKGSKSLLMASDCQPGQPLQVGNNHQISVHCESMEEITRLFSGLGEGGQVLLPLQDMFWGAHFGMVMDRFGVHWMFNYDLPKQG